jgi:hypothetical protein
MTNRSLSIAVPCVVGCLGLMMLSVAAVGRPIASPPDSTASSQPDTAQSDVAVGGTIGAALIDPSNPIRVLFEGERLDLWSLRPIELHTPSPLPHRELVPAASPVESLDAGAWQHPVDQLLFGMPSPRLHSSAELALPNDALDRRQLLQRLFLDLTGLKPSFEEVEDFLAQTDPTAEEQWVDRLLASPAYGEHWARMWLDVVRYSDSNGFDWDEFRKEAWRYRDFVVRAFNSDMPYDTFLTLQLAGDEWVDGTPKNAWEQDALLATGYLRLGPYDNAAKLFNEQDRARVEVLSDLTETTAAAMLGLTMSCCRCHDHKTDPLSHADHFRFRAFFAATQFEDSKSIELDSTMAEIESHNARVQTEIESLRSEIARRLAENARQLEASVGREGQADEPPALPTAPVVPDAHVAPDPPVVPESEEQRFEKLSDSDRALVEAARSQIQELQQELRQPSVAMLMVDNPDAIDSIRVLDQGDHHRPREEVQPGFPSVLDPNAASILKPIGGKSTGRRLALARWIASPDNPWTARVIVNRVWLHLFGEGLVATPNDFGISGAPPSHQPLLDHLARTLIESGWSIKALQRHIVTSHAYRMRALPSEPAQSDASANRVSVRHSLRRMSAEQLRDAVLQVCGRLQHRPGGPPIWPELSMEILQANPAVLDDNETKTKGWYPSPDRDQSVRSLYLIQKRTLRLPWMETFDLPENTVSCPKRDVSIVATQSLSLWNAPWVTTAATDLADRIAIEFGSDVESMVRALFRRILIREPKDEELQQCCRYLERRTLAELALVLINTNEFAFVP